MMDCYLAIDLGGTKTLLQLCNAQGEVLVKQNLASGDFASFDAMLADFLNYASVKKTIDVACIAVAGPVTGRQARVTKLPWLLDADKLAAQFNIDQVILCNDFQAVGHGIDCLTESELELIQAGEPSTEVAPRAVIGAGTGLGQAILVPEQSGWRVLATEGGHVDFAPTDRRQGLLLEHLTQRFGHVSYDRIVCGSGLEILYHFIRDYEQRSENKQLRLAMMEQDPAAVISQFALENNDPLAKEALQLFVTIYGAQAGNLALSCLPRSGLYIAGGIAAKNLPYFKSNIFIDAFLDKGRMRPLMEQIPVYLVLQPEVGLKGADLLARKALYNEAHDGKN